MIKKIISNYHAISLVFIMLLVASCAKDDSTGPGSEERDKYVGSWTCKETPAGQPSSTFTINIIKSGSSDTLLVQNFNQLGNSTQAIWLVADVSITIPNQTITAVEVIGTGFYSNDKLELNYSADSDQLTAVCTR